MSAAERTHDGAVITHRRLRHCLARISATADTDHDPFKERKMCWFITVSVPRGEEAPLVHLGLEGSGVSTTLSDNPSLASALPEGDVQWLIQGRGCACDLYRSPDAPRRPDDDGDEGSEADLERACREGDVAAADEAAIRLDRRARRRFRETVAELTQLVGAVRLFARFYEGDVSTEVVGELSALTLSTSRYLAGLGAFPPDTIVTVVAGAPEISAHDSR